MGAEENLQTKIQKQITEKEKQIIALQAEINQLKTALKNLDAFRQLVNNQK